MVMLTDTLIESLEPQGGDYFLWDSEVSGFGVKITPSGARTFVLQWRTNERPRRTRRRKIAGFGDVDTEAARKSAAHLKRNVLSASGAIDPAGWADSVVTVGDAVAEMVRERRHSHDVDAFEPRQVLPRWTDKQLDEIRPADITELLESLYGKDAVIALPTVEALLDHRRSPPLRVGTTDRTLSLPARTASDKRAATASQILSAATEVFLEQGFGASLDRIAERSGVTKPTIYLHFGNKDELFKAAVYVIAEQVTPVFDIRPNADIFTTLLAFGHVYRYLLVRRRNINFYRLAVSSVNSMASLWHDVGQMTTGTVLRRLSRYLQEAINHGRILPINPEIAAEHFLVAVGGLEQARLLLGLLPADEGHTEAYLQDVVETFVRGIGGEVPHRRPDTRAAAQTD